MRTQSATGFIHDSRTLSDITPPIGLARGGVELPAPPRYTFAFKRARLCRRTRVVKVSDMEEVGVGGGEGRLQWICG